MMHCPICNSKLMSVQRSLIHPRSNKQMQRQCRGGHNHSLLFYSDPKTNKVCWIKIALNSNYSMFAEVDYIESIITIRGMRCGIEDFKLVIPKIIDLDFPKLECFKEKIKMYVSFS